VIKVTIKIRGIVTYLHVHPQWCTLYISMSVPQVSPGSCLLGTWVGTDTGASAKENITLL
jgi:hypothetical protein